MKKQVALLRKQPILSEGSLTPIVNSGWVKPHGGLWTSSYLGPKRISGWVEWCRVEVPELAKGTLWLLEPDKSARIAVIDTYSDLDQLLSKYALVGGLLDDLGIRYLDYEAMALDFDGLHLTDRGQWATRLSFPFNLYGWDCESTLWFRWAFKSAREIGPVEEGVS